MNEKQLKERFRKDIERDGWATVGVFPTEQDDGPGFSYSIGLREHDQPEVIILGLPAELAHELIACIHQLVKEGLQLRAGDRLSEVIEGYEAELRPVPPDGRPLNMARMYYDVDELPALQLVWPDEDGKFPGEEGCAEHAAKAQDLEALRDVDGRMDELGQRMAWSRNNPKPPSASHQVTAIGMGAYSNGVPPGDPISINLPQVEGTIDDGAALFQLFRDWMTGDHLDLERFWSDFDIEPNAIQQFSMLCGGALGTAGPIIGLILTYGAALGKSRYRPKGQPEITI